MVEKMKMFLAFVFLLSNSQAFSQLKTLDNTEFISSSICKKYRCILSYKNIKNHVYVYNVTNLKTKKTFKTHIWSGGYTKSAGFGGEKINNNFLVEAEVGSQYTSPSFDVLLYFQDVVLWSTGLRLDLKNDLLGSMNDVSTTQVDAFSIAISKISSIPVTIYVKSDPFYDTGQFSSKPNLKKGFLSYGIIDTEAFPDSAIN